MGRHLKKKTITNKVFKSFEISGDNRRGEEKESPKDTPAGSQHGENGDGYKHPRTRAKLNHGARRKQGVSRRRDRTFRYYPPPGQQSDHSLGEWTKNQHPPPRKTPCVIISALETKQTAPGALNRSREKAGRRS